MNIFTVLIFVALLAGTVYSSVNDSSVEFYSDIGFQGRSVKFENIGCTVTGCTNLSSTAFNIRSTKSDGCVNLYADSGCNGATVKLIRGSSDLSNQDFANRVRSFRSCESSANELPSLETTIISIDFHEDIVKTIEAAQRPVDLAAAFTFMNNGSQVQEKHVARSKTVKQEFVVEKINGLSKMHHVGVDLGVKTAGQVGIPFVAAGSVEIDLRASYAHDHTSSTSARDQNTTSNEETFTVDTTIRVSPCETAVAQFILYVTEKEPVPFYLTMIIRGKKCGKWISDLELRQSIPSDVKYLSNLNDTAITATTNGSMLASVGLRTNLKIDSHAIPDCGVRFDSVSLAKASPATAPTPSLSLKVLLVTSWILLLSYYSCTL